MPRAPFAGKLYVRRHRLPLHAHDLAECLGAERGSVTDIYLPHRFARNLPAIHAPLILLAVFLHAETSAGLGTRRRPEESLRVLGPQRSDLRPA